MAGTMMTTKSKSVLHRWERDISHRVFVDFDGLTLGELCTMLRKMWEDAQRCATTNDRDGKDEGGES